MRHRGVGRDQQIQVGNLRGGISHILAEYGKVGDGSRQHGMLLQLFGRFANLQREESNRVIWDQIENEN